MLGKPFRPPLLTKGAREENHGSSPPPKRRRLNSDEEVSKIRAAPQLVFKTPGISQLPRKPLLAVNNPAVAAEVAGSLGEALEGYYNVLW